MKLSSEDSLKIIAELDGEPDVAVKAAGAIAKLEAREAVPKLVEVLRSTSNDNVRNAAALALSDMREKQAFSEIVKLLGDERTLGNRGTLLYALQPFDCAPILPLLIDFVIGGSYESSREAMHLIESIDVPLESSAWEAYVARLKGALERASDERRPLLSAILAMLAQ